MKPKFICSKELNARVVIWGPSRFRYHGTIIKEETAVQITGCRKLVLSSCRRKPPAAWAAINLSESTLGEVEENMADFSEGKGEGNLLIFMNILWKIEIFILTFSFYYLEIFLRLYYNILILLNMVWHNTYQIIFLGAVSEKMKLMSAPNLTMAPNLTTTWCPNPQTTT